MQNNTALVGLIKNIFNDQKASSLVLKRTEDSKAEEDSEESEKESKESENKEKEKEYKNIKYLNAFVCLASSTHLPGIYGSFDAKLFIQYFEIETPPPQIQLVAYQQGCNFIHLSN